MKRRSNLLLGSCVSGVFAVSSFVSPAAAQGNNVALAESLFQQGRELLVQGKTAEACPKFAESHRIEPATGTLLGLAMCHEQEGKLATAWAEYTEVAAAARRDGQEERVEFAENKAKELEGRLSTLTIQVPDQVAEIEGIEVKRNGVALGEGAWNVASPIDGGQHQIEVTAPGKQPWKVNVTVSIENDAARVAVAVLPDAPKEATVDERSVAADDSKSTTAPPATPREPEYPSTQQWVGIGVAGGGVVSLAVGGGFLLAALGNNSDSEDDCNGNECGPDGFQARQDARDQGNMATVFGIAGAVLLGAGATLYFTGEDTGAGEHVQRAPRLVVGADGEGIRAQFVGSF